LMRSRYSAYALGLLDYLLATWHPSTAPGDLELDAVKWLGLGNLCKTPLFQQIHTHQMQSAGKV